MKSAMYRTRLLERIIVVVVLLIVCGLVSTINAAAQESGVNRMIVYADKGTEQISKHIYGHFSEHLGRCIYEGFWVGEDSPIPNTRGIRNDVVAALKKIKVPVLRWPGGCFADEYHWMDGIGPREKRPTMINTHWGGVTENNHFGTHEFFDLCELLDCEPYLCGNVGSGTVQEMQQWVEYITFDGVSPMADLRRKNGRDEPWKVTYWAVGNENWGCGGSMTPEHYANLYRQFGTYLRNFGDNRLYKVACGPSSANYEWTEVLMQQAGGGRRRRGMQGLALHYYCGSGSRSRSATEFEEVDWFEQLKRALRIEELIKRHSEIMDKYDPQKRVALIVDEWGAWHSVEPGTNRGFLYQQNSMRDALVAGVSLNIFNQHCDRVKMANIAQIVNVLQAMVLTKEEKMIVTPSYHVFEMYTVHHDATLLPIELQSNDYTYDDDSIPAVNASASKDDSGNIHITLCNMDPSKPAEVRCAIEGADAKEVSGRVLTSGKMTDHNTFENPDAVKPAKFSDCKLDGNVLTTTLPAKSVVVLAIK